MRLELEDRLEFETLISDTSAAVIAAPPELVEQAVARALGRVRRFFRADRCALLTVGAGELVVNVRLASYAVGVSIVPPDLNLVELFPWGARTLLIERRPLRVTRLADLPQEAGVDVASWEAMGVRSNLALPLETGGDIRHLIVLHAIGEEREWPEFLSIRLRVLGELLVGALERTELVAGLREAEEAHRATEARLAAGADLAGLGFYEVDLESGVTFFDDRFHDRCGVPPEQREGLQPLEFWIRHLHPDDRPRVMDLRARLHDGRAEQASVECRFLHPTLGERWMHHLGRVVRRDLSGHAVVTLGVLRDITERKRAEAERSDLSRRMVRAHEDERALLARELHDDVTQRLAVLAIDVGRAELAAPGGPTAATMRSVREGLARLSEDVHALAYQLHPAVLEELGLVEALRTACERFERRCGVAVAADLASVPSGLGKDAVLCLFRVAQEALNNVVRHAAARAVSLTLRQVDGGLTLAVRDDGIGFEPAGTGARRRLGLASMRERVRLLHGTLDIESAPGWGTTIIVWLPADGGAP